MRSLLFVPADSERKLEKALGSGADCLILDLEDSVAHDRKSAGRAMAAGFLQAHRGHATRLYVRVNDLGTGLTDADLTAVVAAHPAGIMLPKCSEAGDVVDLATRLRVAEAEAGIEDGSIRILPLITETARAVLAAHTYREAHPRLSGLTWGAEDLSADLGARRTRRADGTYTDVFRLARAVTLLAAASCGVDAIDTVYPDFRDDAGFRADTEDGARDGFTGRMAIHPAQVPVINAVFTPSTEAIEEARAVLAAFAAAGNPGVVAIDGKMFDRPHLKRAERLLARMDAIAS